MSNELKPCPFCGPVKGNPQVFPGSGNEGFFIHCITCGVSTDTFVGQEDAECAWRVRYTSQVGGENDLWMVKCKDGSLTQAASRMHAESMVFHKQPRGAEIVVCYSALPAPPAQGIDLGPGVREIADERQRQVDAEGYSAENDADYKAGELANAALAYLQVAAMDLTAGGRSHVATRSPPACWPWHRLWWKPRDAHRDLVRAGALIAAQLDAIDRQRDAAPGVRS